MPSPPPPPTLYVPSSLGELKTPLTSDSTRATKSGIDGISEISNSHELCRCFARLLNGRAVFASVMELCNRRGQPPRSWSCSSHSLIIWGKSNLPPQESLTGWTGAARRSREKPTTIDPFLSAQSFLIIFKNNKRYCFISVLRTLKKVDQQIKTFYKPLDLWLPPGMDVDNVGLLHGVFPYKYFINWQNGCFLILHKYHVIYSLLLGYRDILGFIAVIGIY